MVSNCVFLTDLFKTAIFRISFMALLAMAGVLVAQFWLIYTHVESVEADRLTKILTEDADTLSHMPLERLKYVVNNHIVDDLHIFVSHIEVFTSDRKPIMGNIPTWPQGLETDGKLHFVKMRFQNGRQYFLHVLAVPLSNGHVLVIGCGLRFLIEQKITLQRAMLVSVVPVFFIALLLSIALGYRALSRIKEMNIAIKKIMGGDIHERLPVRAKQYDGVEQLANSVNHMLDKLEHLVEDIREVGNNIAHDLRTPLSRLRSRLERALVMVESEDS
ncbi:MAG: sensor histidine kinase, partial [Acetobacter sp.]|nr:sensor histidine kinase [Acetobacter sp.]